MHGNFSKEKRKVLVTIKEIAQRAGVSIATVSLALNNKGNIKKETRDQILKIASEGGYSRKKTESKKNILLIKYANSGISIEKNGDFVAKIIDSIESNASENGYNINIKNISAVDWQEAIYSINQEDFSGVIFLSTEAEDSVAEQIKCMNIPVVAVDNMFEHVNINAVSIDNMGGVYEAVKYAKNMGHKNIGYIHSSVNFDNINQRKESFQKSMKLFNLNYKDEYMIEVMPTLDGAYEDMLRILNSKKELPSLYVAANDTIAIGIIKALKEYNIVVPRDISVIGFDDIPFCTMMDSPLTTMKVNKRCMGEKAMQLLLQNIDFPEQDNIKILIRPKLIERESVRQIN